MVAGHQLGHSLPFAERLASIRFDEMQPITRQTMYGDVAAARVCGFRTQALDHQASIRAAETNGVMTGQ